MKGLVSIIMPVYNGAETIREAIESVMDQSHTKWELIVIDDGSTDDTSSIVEQIDDFRIRLFKQANAGVSAARNVALQEMNGDFFCFLDADDILYQHSLRNRLEVFADSRVSFVDGEVLIFNHTTGAEIKRSRQNFQGVPFDALMAMNGSCFFGPTWMIRKQSGRTYRFEETLHHCEDLIFYLSIADQGEYRAIPSPVYGYRVGNSSAMQDLRALDLGYRQATEILSNWPHVSEKQLKSFRRKAKSIMIKSYLKAGNFQHALKRLLKA